MTNLSNDFNSRTISLILGGGVGSRLFPLTQVRSKPAVPIGGKYRLIDIPISNCLNSGLKKMFVLTMYNSASLNRHIKNTYHFDGFSDAFVDILAAEQTQGNLDWFQGTADAVRQTLPNTSHANFDLVLILSGDQLYQMDFSKLLKNHVDNGAEITIATIPVVAEDATSFGIMKVAEDGSISRFIEKPKTEALIDWTSMVDEAYTMQNKNYLASMGIYVFNRSTLERLLLEEYSNAVDFGKEIIPNAIKNNYKVFSYAFGDYWTDIGDIRSFFDANIDLSSKTPLFNLFHRTHHIYTRPRLLPPAKLYGTKCTNAVIAEGSLVYAKSIERSVIGVRSLIYEDTTILNTYVMGNDYYEYPDQNKSKIRMGIGKNCHIENAIVDKHVRIGNNVTIIGDESLEDITTDNYTIKKGIVVVHKNGRIPDGSKIGKV